jgi:hypothetical protein
MFQISPGDVSKNKMVSVAEIEPATTNGSKNLS